MGLCHTGDSKQNLRGAAGNWVAAPFQVFILAFLSMASFNLHPFVHERWVQAISVSIAASLVTGFTILGILFSMDV